MKITIIQFSPSGSTLKVSLLIKKELETSGHEVQLIDVTGNERVFINKDIRAFLAEHIRPHDMLLIGSPVYAHHLQYHVQDIISALPKPDAVWGKYAIPYVCYGGISSGIALGEAARLLKKSGRIIPAGLKVSAPHSMTKAFMDNEFNGDKLNGENHPAITALVGRITQLGKEDDIICKAKYLDYAGLKTKLKAKFIFKEKLWHEKRYPKINIDKDLCTGCGKCAKHCPVLHLSKSNKTIYENDVSPCIHCFNCVSSCPANAIGLTGDMERGKAFMSKMIAKHGNSEMPETAVYPIMPEEDIN